jgi:hypothetical protein
VGRKEGKEDGMGNMGRRERMCEKWGEIEWGIG